MGMSYISSREGVTPVAGDMLLGWTTGADELARIMEIMIGGEAAASAVNRMAVRRSTTNLITPTAQTPAKRSPTSPASYTLVATTAATQPVTAALPALWTQAFNVFGGQVLWRALEADEGLIIVGATVGSSELSLEASSGTGVISGECVHEDL